MECLIIAAGQGTRLVHRAESKPLLPIGRRPLIEWVIRGGREAGLRDFVVVTGYAGEKVERHLRRLAEAEKISVSFIRNDEWEKENGLSVFKARSAVGEKFILSMSDHIFDPEILRDLAGRPIEKDETILAVDFNIRNNACVDLEDVTRVRTEGGRILAIGKGLADYNAFDTGLFLCTPALFSALEQSQGRGDFSLSGGLRILAEDGRARVMDIGGRYWIDVDDERAVARAERLLNRRSGKPA